MTEETILQIKNLFVNFAVLGGEVNAVNGVTLNITRGKTLGIVGESGCGKSVLATSILKLLPKSARISGDILLNRNEGTVNIAQLEENSKMLRSIRGGEISMIFQEPMRALFPLKSIGDQLGEVIRLHVTQNAKEIHSLSVELLRTVGIREPESRLMEYPHQFSGGMCQRVMIAIALAGKPDLLIADEPTTALDVTIQAQVLTLIQRKQREFGMSILFISHDMGVIMEMADEVAVMYLGRIIEKASAEEIFSHPLHPYTELLFKAIPSIHGSREKRLASIEGNVPIPLNLKPSCGFYDRCPKSLNGICNKNVPILSEVESDHWVSCFRNADGNSDDGKDI